MAFTKPGLYRREHVVELEIRRELAGDDLFNGLFHILHEIGYKI